MLTASVLLAAGSDFGFPAWRLAGRVADLAVQVHGGTGYMREIPVERIYREVRLLRLYEGTSEIQRLIIGGCLYRDQRKTRPGTPA